jgi:proline iminopeptidase
VLERLGEIDVPTLVLTGAHDWIDPPEQGGERLHAGLPDSELVVFDRSGHFPFAEEPQAFQTAVQRWLRRVVQSIDSRLPDDGLRP